MNGVKRRTGKEDPWDTPGAGPEAPEGGGGGYLQGALGSLVGAIIGAVPTVLTGMLGFVSGWLALLIPFAARKGYKLCQGARNEGFAFGCILVWSLLASVATSVFICWPYWLEAGVMFFLIPIIFALVGAFTCRRGLKLYTQPELMEEMAQRARAENAANSADQTEFYHGQRKLVWPLRLSALLAMFPELFLMLGFLLLAIPTESFRWILASLGACVGFFLVTFALVLPMTFHFQPEAYLYVHTGDGRLWRVLFPQLNAMENYRFTAKSAALRALSWDRLDAGEREVARASVLRAIADIDSGNLFPGSALSRVVIPLEDPILVKETKWLWKVDYRTDSGKRKRVTIPKAYLGLQPTPNAQSCQGPVPYRWGVCVVALVVTLALASLGGLVGLGLEGEIPTSGPKPEPGGKIQASLYTPAQTTAYEHGGVRYQVDSSFLALDTGVYYDGLTYTTEGGGVQPGGGGVEYTVQVFHGCDTARAEDALTATLSGARRDLEYANFQFQWTEGGTTLVPLANGREDCGYNILTIRFEDGRRWYAGVVLAPDGTLVTIGVTDENGKNREEQVQGTVAFILQSVEITLTEDNYQLLFQPARNEGYEHMGVAYYKAPEDRYGPDAFLDAYLPYGGELVYSEDGHTVTAAAHGMEVTQTMAYSAEGARAVVDAAYQAMVDAGVDFYESGVYDTQYSESYDIAYKQVTYFSEDGLNARVAVLYADTREEGWYLSAQITYLPEEMDEEYPLLLEELRDVFALTLPELPASGI